MSYASSSAQLANLKPFQAGNRAPRRSADVTRAITDLRKWVPKAVAYCGRLVEDEHAEPALRLRAAIAIMDKTIPNAGQDALQALAGARVASITVHVVEGAGEAPGPPGVDVTREPPTLDQKLDDPSSRLHIFTVEGHGDD